DGRRALPAQRSGGGAAAIAPGGVRARRDRFDPRGSARAARRRRAGSGSGRVVSRHDPTPDRDDARLAAPAEGRALSRPAAARRKQARRVARALSKIPERPPQLPLQKTGLGYAGKSLDSFDQSM